MIEPTTEDLVRGAMQGDGAAFGQIYDRFLPQVKRFLLGLHMPLAQQDLDDAVQETFLRCYRGLGGFDPKRPLRPYLLTVARNVAIDLCRKRATDQARPAADELESVRGKDSVSDRVRRLEQSDLLGAALAALEPELRTVLVLRHVNGLKMKELEECLQCSAPTARARVREAGHRLAVELRRRGLVAEEVCA